MLNLKELRQKYGGRIDPLDFDLLLASAIKKPREFLYTHPEQKISAGQFNNFKKLLTRRRRGEPLAYILGHKEFYGLNFEVNKNVLIPRPETELMVETAIERIKNNKILLVDIGTGSGCVAIVAAKILKYYNIKILATDISAEALTVARRNAKKHGVKIKFLQGDLLKQLQKTLQLYNFQTLQLIITANLPYGWKEWKNSTSAETVGLKFEPSIALFTGKKGLQLYEELLQQIKQLVKILKYCNIIIFLEIDPRQTKSIKSLVKKYLPIAKVEIKKDLCGLDRLAIVKI